MAISFLTNLCQIPTYCAHFRGAFHLVASAGKERSAHARGAPGAFHLWRMPARVSKARHSILGLPGLEKKEGGRSFQFARRFTNVFHLFDPAFTCKVRAYGV